MRNHSYEDDFDLHENETTCRTHFHMKGFALRLALKQRHKRTRKWPTLNTKKRWPQPFFNYYRGLNLLQPRSRSGISKSLGNEVCFATGNARSKGLL